MKILAVDTAFGSSSVCILDTGKVKSLIIENKKDSQAERLFVLIAESLKESNLTYNDIDIFSANLGPGSFTGIRIGLSGILAVAYALNKKFVGLNSFEGLVNNYLKLENKNKSNEVCALINANRNEIYAECFDKQELINLNSLEKYCENKNKIFICDNEIILEKLKNVQSPITYYPSPLKFTAQDIAETAYHKIINNTADYARKSPLYIRKPDAKLPTKYNSKKLVCSTN